MGILRSAAARIVSPARTPSPPLYVGMPTSRPISMEKYAMVLLVSIGSPCMAYTVRRSSVPLPDRRSDRLCMAYVSPEWRAPCLTRPWCTRDVVLLLLLLGCGLRC